MTITYAYFARQFLSRHDLNTRFDVLRNRAMGRRRPPEAARAMRHSGFRIGAFRAAIGHLPGLCCPSSTK